MILVFVYQSETLPKIAVAAKLWLFRAWITTAVREYSHQICQDSVNSTHRSKVNSSQPIPTPQVSKRIQQNRSRPACRPTSPPAPPTREFKSPKCFHALPGSGPPQSRARWWRGRCQFRMGSTCLTSLALAQGIHPDNGMSTGKNEKASRCRRNRRRPTEK